MHQRVIGGKTHLTCVGDPSPGQLARRVFKIGAGIHDGRILATHFQRDRGKMLRRCLHHQPADGMATDVEDMVERLPQQFLRGLGTALHHRELVLRIHRTDNIGQHLGRVRRELRRFEHDGVAGRQCAH